MSSATISGTHRPLSHQRQNHSQSSSRHESSRSSTPITPPPSPPLPSLAVLSNSRSCEGARVKLESPLPPPPPPHDIVTPPSRSVHSQSGSEPDLYSLPLNSYHATPRRPFPTPIKSTRAPTSYSRPSSSGGLDTSNNNQTIQSLPQEILDSPSSSSSSLASQVDEPALRGPAPARRALNLQPRSAVPNYFNLDLSFLYDEEPPAGLPSFPNAKSNRHSSPSDNGAHRFSTASADSQSSSIHFRSPSLASSTRLIFPSRPRRNTGSSVASGRRLSQIVLPASPRLAPGASPRTGGRPRFNRDGHRVHNSVDSGFRGSRTSTDHASGDYSSDSMEVLPSRALTPEDEEIYETEKRKRLAQFLSETASAMEGGKSLAMVVPEVYDNPSTTVDGTNEPSTAKTFSELAEQTHTPLREYPPRLRTIHRSPSGAGSSNSTLDALATPSGMPGAFATPPQVFRRKMTPRSSSSGTVGTTGSNESNGGGHRRGTRYFTPILSAEDDQDGEAESISSKEISRTDSASAESHGAATGAGTDTGLGFNIDPTFLSADARSPSTMRAASPARSLSFKSVEAPAVENDADGSSTEAAFKVLERRRRTIRELIETEAIFASDLAVARDIFLARARGCDLDMVADHVMTSGLGLGSVMGDMPPSPPPSASSGTFPPLAGAKLDQRRPTISRRGSAPQIIPRESVQSIMNQSDIRTIFGNLEEVAKFAEQFSEKLDNAWRNGPADSLDDEIGKVFLQMMPRMQEVFSRYCAQHNQAIERFQELESSLETYLAECKTLCHGRTNAWDLDSLLIKPVQRVLKYPLLLDQILSATPSYHPDRIALERANRDILEVAQHINEAKKKTDGTGKPHRKGHHRRQSSGTGSSFGRSMSKKFLRSSKGPKPSISFAVGDGGNEGVDTLVLLIESTHKGVIRFSNEMKEWVRTTSTGLEAQVTAIEGSIKMNAPFSDEIRALDRNNNLLCAFLDTVLRPTMDGPWRDLEQEFQESIYIKVDNLLTMFDSPQMLIAKRNDRHSDYARYAAKRLPADRAGSDEYQSLTAQLLKELPTVLALLSRYLNIVVVAFKAAQAEFHQSVQERWDDFVSQWLASFEDEYQDVEEVSGSAHLPLSQLLDNLARGLGVNSQVESRPSSRRPSLTQGNLHEVVPVPALPRPLIRSIDTRSPDFGDYSWSSPRSQSSGTNRGSQFSDVSVPSFVMSSAGSSSIGSPATPPPPSFSSSNGTPFPSKFGEKPTPNGRPASAYLSDSSQGSNKSGEGFLRPGPRIRKATDDATRLVNTLSQYIPTEEELEAETRKMQTVVLYVAEACNDSSTSGRRNGEPVLSFKMGELLYVEREEADTEEGGDGWLYGQLEGGVRGWARSEEFMMRD
ncbi:hypothetical protein T439DRAFT_20534 [Meredithblackwellia eburnea MCA 4105]